MNRETLREEFIMDQDWSKETVRWGWGRLKLFFGYLDEREIDLLEMTSSQSSRILSGMREQGYSWSTRNGLYNVVGSFYRWLFQNGHITHNLFANRETRPKRPRKSRSVIQTAPQSYTEAIIRFAAMDTSPNSCRGRAIISLLVSTGMRRCEVANLRLPDVDIEQHEILLRHTKLNHQRYVFLTDNVAQILKSWLEARPSGLDHDAVFVSLHPSKKGIHHPLRPNAINKLFDRLKRGAGIPKSVKLTPHMLRHSFATEVARAGDPFALKELLGHANIQTTEIYVHNNKRRLREVAKYAPDVEL